MKRTCDTSQTFQTTSNRHFNWSECILPRKKQQPHSKKKHTHRKSSQASRCYCTVIIEVSYFKVKSSHNNLQIHRKGFNRECIGREENNQKKEKNCQQLGYYTLWMREPANAIGTCILEDRHLKCALNVDFERLLHSMCACVHFFFLFVMLECVFLWHFEWKKFERKPNKWRTTIKSCKQIATNFLEKANWRIKKH